MARVRLREQLNVPYPRPAWAVDYLDRAWRAGAFIVTEREMVWDDPAKLEAFQAAERARTEQMRDRLREVMSNVSQWGGLAVPKVGEAYQMGPVRLEAVRIEQLHGAPQESDPLRELIDPELADARSHAAHQTSANLQLHRKLDQLTARLATATANSEELWSQSERWRSMWESAAQRIADLERERDGWKIRAEALEAERELEQQCKVAR